MHARLGRFNAILLAAALARAAFETLDALEEVTNLASVTREVSDVFDTIGGPDLGNCAVPIHILVAVDGAIEVEAVGLKLIDAIADFNVGVDSASESALIQRVTSAMADAFASDFSKAVSMEVSLCCEGDDMTD